MTTPQTFLNLGLQKGFAGETHFTKIQRAGFELQASHLVENGDVYHDEWAAERVGGGQELIKVGEKMHTRVYAGGTISDAAMSQLGVSKKDVMSYLIRCLHEFGAKTRLDANFGPEIDNDWSYQYRVIDRNESIPMTTGKEEISYKGQIVFVHVFVMCPVE